MKRLRKLTSLSRRIKIISEIDINDYKQDKHPQPEYTGGSVSYYKVMIASPLAGVEAYTAECNDIIEALNMNYAEGNAFKALWRRCAAKTLGLGKAGYTDGLYDAEKVEFFGKRLIEQEKQRRGG